MKNNLLITNKKIAIKNEPNSVKNTALDANTDYANQICQRNADYIEHITSIAKDNNLAINQTAKLAFHTVSATHNIAYVILINWLFNNYPLSIF